MVFFFSCISTFSASAYDGVSVRAALITGRKHNDSRESKMVQQGKGLWLY